MKKIVTRIAPSNTGDLHIGTARTALFNYLYAKHTGGEFRLRIEDTDAERSTDHATQVIYDGLGWLGLDWDGPVVLQSANKDRHVEVANAMVANGSAYRDYRTPTEADAWKNENKGKAYRSPYRNVSATSRSILLSDLDTVTDHDLFVVRLKVPVGEDIVVNDLVKGPITFKTDNLDDIVLLRSDGTPTYNLAVVVDDYDMGITHVIRGDDHVNNTPRQMLIYTAMGWDLPDFGHIPLIFNEEGKKLSKRDGAASIMDFADAGYLPEAMRNYLTRLGWGHGDNEIFTDEQAIEWFDIKDVLSSPARMNAKKLNYINRHYLGAADGLRLASLVVPSGPENPTREIMDCLKGNASTIVELRDNFYAWVLNVPEPDDKAKEVLSDEVTTLMLRGIAACLDLYDDAEWAVDGLNADLHSYAEKMELPMKKLGQGMRAALTGKVVAPDLGRCLVAIGRTESLRRLKRV
jgi:glutamyl-tRNA synthetase